MPRFLDLAIAVVDIGDGRPDRLLGGAAYGQEDEPQGHRGGAHHGWPLSEAEPNTGAEGLVSYFAVKVKPSGYR